MSSSQRDNNTDLLAVHNEAKTIQIWLKTQPVAQLQESAKLLLLQLNALSTIEFEQDARFKLLELLHPAVEYTCYTLCKHYVGPEAHTSTKTMHVIGTLQQLQIAIINNYQLIIDAILAQKDIAPYLSQLGTSLYHSMTHLSEILITCYQFYTAVPGQVWYHLHQLYKDTEQHQLLDFSPGTVEISSVAASNLHNLYLQTLMLASADPYKFQRHDLEVLIAALPKWLHFVALNKLHEKKGQYVIFADEDAPPLRIEFLQADAFKGNYRCLDIDALEKHIDFLITQATNPAPDQPAPPAPLHILTRLSQAWGKAAPRQFPRVALKGQMQMIFGIANIHYYVSGQAQAEIDADIKLQPTTTVQTNKLAEKKAAPKVVAWQLVDTSPNGYCLIRPFDPSLDIQAGEIVGVKEEIENAPGRWSIGAIRWVKHQEDDQLKIGIQLLAPPMGVPIQFQLRHPNRAESNYIAGFLMPAVRHLQQKQTLLLPTLPYSNKDYLHIKTAKEEYDVVLKKLIVNSHQFSQHEFELIEPKEVFDSWHV